MAKSLINQCTTDEVGQPSGFKLQELAKCSQNSIQECQYIEEMLLKKLGKDRPLVKLKALRIIKFLCMEGRDQFRLDMHNHTDAVRKCSQYRGPPDPLYGDRHYQQVRQAAKDTMTAIFAQPADRNRTRSKITGMEGGSRGGQPPPPSDPPPSRFGMSGYGSGTYGGGGSGGGGYGGGGGGFGGGGPSRYPGFGNTPSYTSTTDRPQSSITGRVTGAISSMFSRTSSSTGAPNDFNPEPHETPPPYNPTEPSRNREPKESFRDPYALPATFEKPKRRKKKKHTRSKRNTSHSAGRKKIPGWEKETDSEEEEDEDEEEEEEEIPHRRRPSGPYGRNVEPSRPTHRAQKAQELGRYERKVVDEITSMGRGSPPQSELNKFVQNFSSLHQETICNFLMEKLDAQKQSVKLRTLVILDELLKSEHSRTVKDFLKDDLEEVLLELTNTTNRQVRNRATALAVKLGFKEREETRAVRARSRSNPRPQASSRRYREEEEDDEEEEEEEEEEDDEEPESLIDWDVNTTTTTSQQQSSGFPFTDSQPQAAAESDPTDMFAKMNIHASEEAPQAPAEVVTTSAPVQAPTAAARASMHPMDDFLINELRIEKPAPKMEAPIFDPLDSGFLTQAAPQQVPQQVAPQVYAQPQRVAQQPTVAPVMQQPTLLDSLVGGTAATAAPSQPQASSFSFLQEQPQQQPQMMFQQPPQQQLMFQQTPQQTAYAGHNVHFEVRAQSTAPKPLAQQRAPAGAPAGGTAGPPGGFIDPFATTPQTSGAGTRGHNPYTQQTEAFNFVNDLLTSK